MKLTLDRNRNDSKKAAPEVKKEAASFLETKEQYRQPPMLLRETSMMTPQLAVPLTNPNDPFYVHQEQFPPEMHPEMHPELEAHPAYVQGTPVAVPVGPPMNMIQTKSLLNPERSSLVLDPHHLDHMIQPFKQAQRPPWYLFFAS